MAASNLLTFAIGVNTETPVLTPNTKRRRIMFAWSNANVGYFRVDPIGNVLGGFPLTSGMGAVVLDYREVGDIVTGPFFFFSGTAATLGIIETIE